MTGSRAGSIFILIIIPFLLISWFDTRRAINYSHTETYYNNVLELSMDASTMMLFDDVVLDGSGNVILNKEAALQGFFDVLNRNLNRLTIDAQEETENYIPLFMIIDYDGVYVYSPELFTDSGQNVVDHVWHEKKYFTTTEGNKVITMYLNDYYVVHDQSKDVVFKGTYDELSTIGASTLFNQSKADLESLRQSIVLETIENELLRINNYNEYAEINGVNYTFFLPGSEYDMNTNTIEGVGVFAVIQGLPMGGRRFNTFSYSGSTIEEVAKVVGYDDGGNLYYYDEGVTPATGTMIEVFNNAMEAAKAGYHPGQW